MTVLKPRIFKRNDEWVLVAPLERAPETAREYKAKSFSEAIDLLDLWIGIWHFRTFRRLAASVGAQR